MNISGIDFPRPLLEALKDNQLVVFVGAGVSIPEPAGLPTFRQLAEAVALEVWPESHWPGFALRQTDVL